MKFLSLSFASLLFCFALVMGRHSIPPPLVSNGGPSVDGSFEFPLDHGNKRHINFQVSRDSSGEVAGEAIFKDDKSLGEATGVDGAKDNPVKALFLKAQLDCLVITGNKAVMGGTINEASWPQYVGRRILIVAQDNDGAEAGEKRRDKLTWGVYRNLQNDKIVVDSERPDELAAQSWLATDAERPEDEGVMTNQQTVVGCQTFPLSSFSFVTATLGQGSVSLKP